jgi:transposase-like protein
VEEIETEWTEKPVCPKCGHTNYFEECDAPRQDVWEERCESCGASYNVTRNYEITYSTEAA